ncbi:MAG: DUF222 domain-containing protein [Jatrophihabitantaceae bacterium]
MLARDVLRIGVGEANARRKAAEALGRRRALTGELLPSIYARVAAAQASGSVAVDAARVITGLIDKLPDAIRCEQDLAVETFMLEQAAILDLDALKLIARRLESTLDPDGTFKDGSYRRKHRDVRFTVRSDGSCHGEFDGTAEFTEWLRTTLDTLARPQPEADGVKDDRTPGQRRHDGLLAAFKLLARANQLPACAGITTSVILTMSQRAYTTGEGTATTGHGAILPAEEARSWIGGDARILPVKLGPMKRVDAYGTAHRLFTETQRLAMIARDHGCAFPGCTAPPQWTEAHHVVPYAQGGPTSVDSGVLLCGYHHDTHEQHGWTCTMINRLPHWVPPRWRDPDQVPVRNRAYDPLLT